MSLRVKLFHLNPEYSNRVFGLDLMRALAILFVVLGHGGWMLNEANTNFPWIPLIDGVEMFFVLSGFLIGGILIKTFQNTRSLGISTIWNFWIRRWFRTLPNYYLILLLNVLFVYCGIVGGDFSQFNWKYFLFLQNFSQPFYNFFWESWSLSVEEWFYLLFPILLSCFFVIGKKWKLARKQIFLFSTCVFLLTSFFLRAFIASNFQVDEFWLGVKIYKVVIYRFDGIALGLSAAFLKYWYPTLWLKIRNVSFVLGIILCYAIIYSSWLPNEYSTKVFKIILQDFGCFLLLPKFDAIKSAPPIVTRVITHISLISYSMYLINLSLVSEIIRLNFPPHGPTSAWAMYFTYWGVVIVASTLIYTYYEKPIMDIRNKIKPNRRFIRSREIQA